MWDCITFGYLLRLLYGASTIEPHLDVDSPTSLLKNVWTCWGPYSPKYVECRTIDYIGSYFCHLHDMTARLFLKSQWLIIMGYFKPIMVYFGV